MGGKYVELDLQDLKKFISKVDDFNKSDFNKELALFLDALGIEFLRIVEDEIIRSKTVDTRKLLKSFTKSSEGNIYKISEGSLELEVGTNVTYASFVNDGHWLNPKGKDIRFVPGRWDGDRFIYDPHSSEGMLLRQKFIKGSHYWDSAIRIIKRMIPRFLDRKIEDWMKKYFKEFM